MRVSVYVFRKRASHFIKTKDPILYQALAAASECSVCQRNFLSICIECVMFVSIKKVSPAGHRNSPWRRMLGNFSDSARKAVNLAEP